MVKRILFTIVLTTVYFYNVESRESFHSDPNFSARENAYFLHQVEKGQTIYSISVFYGVTVEAIYKLNPESEKGIKIGESLKIPQQNISAPSKDAFTVKAKESEIKSETETETETEIIPVPEATINTASINVALLLPFGTVDRDADPSNQNQRLVEYYEGFLLALDSLKKAGISVNLHVYDIGNHAESLQTILNKKELKDNHLIIGGKTEEQIKSISDYSQTNGIWYAVPFSSKADETLVNPYVFQINPPQALLYSSVSQAFIDKYKEYRIIFVNIPNMADSQSKFIQTLQIHLSKKNLQYNELVYNASTFAINIREALSKDKKNIIVLSSASSTALMRVMSPLKSLKESNTFTDVSLFGYPEWQTYFKDHIDDFFLTNACLYSVFYVDHANENIRKFYETFKSWYRKIPTNTYPKYGLLGYDTGMYFIQMFHRQGTACDAFAEPMKYQSLQSGFYFKRLSEWGGFVNNNVFLIDFLPDYTIKKTVIK
ncbi:MAG: LysM peptidoglycan-binding domain-containing protein [Dysgonamonadaceae bacterium]|jgi:ABC-type branched-subunit amino acid transport system substrate-binding protein|nr:LysM peptidoglycan-binding domain-containing protein [Dysgonamonadaceae bacterium]